MSTGDELRRHTRQKQFPSWLAEKFIKEAFVVHLLVAPILLFHFSPFSLILSYS